MLLKSIFQAIKIIKNFQPNTVLSMGGYISFPCAVAAYVLRKKIIVHEQNIIFGMTNNLIRFFSNLVILGFPMSINNKKYKFLGNPSRYENSILEKKNNKKEFNILVIGGSLGAKIFNEVIPQSIYKLINTTNLKVNVIHQTGKTYKVAEIQYRNININIDLREYIEDMEEVYNWCDVIVCRGGAITITEIMNLGIPAIIIPYPYSVDDHQMKNCEYLQNNNAAIVINQENLTQDYLASIFLSLIKNSNITKELKKNVLKLNMKDSTKNICDEIINNMRNN